ncbi:Clusterin-associated protein 1, partial [Globisporangium splendens]
MTERQCEELEAEEKALVSKMKKAQTDLEHSEKRLKSLQHVRPAFMGEYEKLERELERQYAIYCERFRNLDYLQRELDLHNSRELKKLAENDRSLKKLRKKFRDDELAILRGEQEDQMENGLLDDNNNSGSNQKNGGKKQGNGNSNQKAKAVNGAQQSSGASNKKRATSDDESGSEDESGSDDDGSSDGSPGNDDDRSSGSDSDQVTE